MLTPYKSSRASVFTLLGLIIALAIVLFLAKRGLEVYFKPVTNPETEKTAREAGINTANYQALLPSMKEKVQGLMDKHQKDLEEALQESSP